MKTLLIAIALVQVGLAATPVISELRPRGAELGKPFTLTVIGRYLVEGAHVSSTLPAAFTPLSPSKRDAMQMGPGRAAAFLVEPKPDAAPGVYPIRLETPSGISNILLFTVGTFPETTEEESLPYARPNQNDTVETAEPAPPAPVVINGTLRGPERDVFRVQGKAGERRVFEVEARRCGSAIDPVLLILDSSGKQLARSDDAPGASLDARIDFTFPRDGNYYVEVHDARFSTQVQNFYRLKMGAYPYADGIFPLGARRGEAPEVSLFGGSLKSPAKAVADLRKIASGEEFAEVALSGSPALPFRFAVSDLPELIDPAENAVSIPSVINGRLAQPEQINRYHFQAEPGEKLLFEIQARELGTSRLEAILTAYDEHGKKIDSAGDKPLPEDVFAVQGTSRTSSDPFLNVEVPKDSHAVTIAVEDLARRGGPFYGYRLIARRQAEDFRLAVVSPYVNIPKGGTVTVTVAADRRGYDGPIQLTVADLPKGIRVEGGIIPRETLDSNNVRSMNRRGVLTLTADAATPLPARELVVWGEGKLADGTTLRRRAHGTGMMVDVAGATAQGVVDRQRPLTAPWLGFDLPASTAEPALATLEVRLAAVKRMEEGARYEFTYQWHIRTPGAQPVRNLNVDVVGARDIRVTDMKRSPSDDPETIAGTFNVNTTKATDAGRYDMIVTGRLNVEGRQETIASRSVPFEVTSGSASNAVASNR
ncbi:MAG TPA: PPC domain-containing protein [Bryobacterales bacterium]|nr:PPC domain-containing protein [Bryobacterales bacterium]